MKQRLLVTGGAGFIGSILTAYLLDNGYEVIVVDDLSTGHSKAVDSRATFVNTSILNKPQIIKALVGVNTVIHCAGKALVEESMSNPDLYNQVNNEGTKTLLESMSESNVFSIIFSSTAAVYGESKVQPIAEGAVINPVNPYGQSKVNAEKLITDFCFNGMAAVTFRYFNISGSYKSSTGQLLVENHEKETHLIPKIIYNLVNNKETAQIEIYGNNWSTNDGSCVRDYLHILDLAHAHLLALENLEEGVHKVFNLGSGTGYSVFEVIDEIEKIVGAKLNRVISPPRLGDPAILLADIDKAKDDLGWIPKADLSQIVFDSLQGFKYIG